MAYDRTKNSRHRHWATHGITPTDTDLATSFTCAEYLPCLHPHPDAAHCLTTMLPAEPSIIIPSHTQPASTVTSSPVILETAVCIRLIPRMRTCQRRSVSSRGRGATTAARPVAARVADGSADGHLGDVRRCAPHPSCELCAHTPLLAACCALARFRTDALAPFTCASALQAHARCTTSAYSTI